MAKKRWRSAAKTDWASTFMFWRPKKGYLKPGIEWRKFSWGMGWRKK